MCLILFAQDVHPDYPLVFAGNRDEFYERPTAPAAFWADAPHVLAGRDLKAGGTWLGVTRRGRWATVTNVRDQMSPREDAPSRGHLVAEYLVEEPDPVAYLESVSARANRYNGFNLIVGTPRCTYYLSNRNRHHREVGAGVHGMSNSQLDDSWPKVTRGTARLRGALDAEVDPDLLLDILEDRTPASDDELPDTGVGLDTERMLSPPFIDAETYGTRASTVFLLHRSGTLTFVEREFEHGTLADTNQYVFEIAAQLTD